ncbi:MAG: urease accessory protein UreD [Pseudomonadota bacterium]
MRADTGAYPPTLQRSHGRTRVRLGDRNGRPQLLSAFQEGSAKLRFPLSAPDGVEALLLNTSGGLAGGDTFATTSVAERHTLLVSTLACERVYKSDDAFAMVRQEMAVHDGAELLHWPQPTILFQESRLHRRTTIDAHGTGTFTLCEGMVLGRAAMGEAVRQTTVNDRISVTVDGTLAFVDALRLSAGVLERVRTAAGLGDARAFGIVIHKPREGVDGSAGVERARDAVAGLADVRAGATTVNGLILARVLARDHTALQDALGRLVVALSTRSLPRAWSL